MMTSANSSRSTQLQALAQVLDIPELAWELGELFADAGHELFLVGGTVRDLLLNRGTSDLDFTTSALPEHSAEVLRTWADDVWLTGAEFGTVSAAKDGETIEITTYRSDTYRVDSRHPDVVFGTNINDDLLRRDFTINAMAFSVSDRHASEPLVDPCGGWEDLRDRVIRTPIEPEVSFGDDPLRMLRMARFLAVLGTGTELGSQRTQPFTVAETARAAATAMASSLQTISAERIRVEMNKLICGEHVAVAMDLLMDTQLIHQFLPEVPALRMEIDPKHHHKDVYTHTLAVVERCDPSDPILRMAALLHDIGKPDTRELHANGTVSFHNHDVVGARMTRHRLRALTYSKHEIREISELVRLHLRFHGYSDGVWTDAAVRRYIHDTETPERLRRLNLLTRADVTTANQAKRRRFAKAMDDLEKRIEELKEKEEIAAVRPALDGNQIMAFLGIAPGPMIGKAWAFMKDQALDVGPMSVDEAYAQLQTWAEEHDITPAGTRVEPAPKKSAGAGDAPDK